ncbi:UDP-N-acetylmuramoyl-L-alanyl-D-glutamate--2,6-diaminopimelate ligase, partial [bacterium]|nr:UDP-N-acetylmuramoyl-L-alanyl-D-glutamate--2,6-diaminopimelate ligase [bacterium]
VGVTGTNGKTTTAFLTKAILDAAGLNAGLLGTVQYQIGDRVIPASRTTPESVEIQDLMRQMLRAGCRAAALEVSSHALDRHRVAGVDFDVAIFTNLSPEHLDYHRTMDEYFAVKSQLFLNLSQGKRRGRAVINLDDTYGRRLVAHLEQLGARVGGERAILTYGASHDATICARDVRMTRDATWFTAHTPQGAAPIRLPLIGRYNVANALAAIGAGCALGIELTTIQEALAAVRPVPGRLERVQVRQPFPVYVDYAHTAEALRGALLAVGELTDERVIVVFGCGGDRDHGKRRPMGWAACELADYAILTSDNPRTEDPLEIIRSIEAGFLSGAERNYQVIPDRREAIERALDIARPGDTVLIAGKGHEAYQEFADTVVPFNDREVVEDYFAQAGIRWTQCA